VAYRQPITRSEIEEIRGVSISSTIMRTLQERNWIRTVGHREVPGRPELLGTTREFLDYFGLRSLEQLPTLAELKDVENIGVQLELPEGESASDGTPEGTEQAEGGARDEAANSAEAAEADTEGAADQAQERAPAVDAEAQVVAEDATSENDADGIRAQAVDADEDGDLDDEDD